MVFASSAVGCCDAGWVRSRPQGLLGGEQQAASGVRSRPQGRRKQRAAWRRPVDLDVPAAEAEVELRPRRGPHRRARATGPAVRRRRKSAQCRSEQCKSGQLYDYLAPCAGQTGAKAGDTISTKAALEEHAHKFCLVIRGWD